MILISIPSYIFNNSTLELLRNVFAIAAPNTDKAEKKKKLPRAYLVLYKTEGISPQSVLGMRAEVARLLPGIQELLLR